MWESLCGGQIVRSCNILVQLCFQVNVTKLQGGFVSGVRSLLSNTVFVKCCTLPGIVHCRIGYCKYHGTWYSTPQSGQVDGG